MNNISRFKHLFGHGPQEIRKTCLLMPMLPKGILPALGIKNFIRGRIYASGSNRFLTLIQTGVGASFLGDAVLELLPTPCQNLIIFGSCGIIQQTAALQIGSLIIPSKSYALESFSQLLIPKISLPQPIYPDRELLKLFLKHCAQHYVPQANCIAFGSLKLEDNFKEFFLRNNIEIVDMESAALFSAAKHINRKALALFYATDILGIKPFFSPRSISERTSIQMAISKGINLIKSFSVVLSKDG
jgi:purine-nucleoside phosphorylase